MGKAHRVVYLKVFVMVTDCTVLVNTLWSHIFLKTEIVLFIVPFSEGEKMFLNCL